MINDAALSHLVAVARRRSRTPAGSSCSICGHRDHLTQLSDGDIRCYSHRSQETGVVELDHFAGRATLPRTVIALDGNAHRRVTEIRRLTGMDDFPMAAGDPILTLAHLLAGIASLFLLFAAWLVEYASFAAGQLNGTPPVFPVQA